MINVDVVNPNVVNALYCELPILAQIQDELIRGFPNTKFWHTKFFVIDIFDTNEQLKIEKLLMKLLIIVEFVRRQNINAIQNFI